jgi:hypothetical protein
MMPHAVSVRIHSGRNGRARLWIPLLPVAVVLFPFLLFAAIVAVATCIVRRANPVRALTAAWRLFVAMRGLHIDVQQGRTQILVFVR